MAALKVRGDPSYDVGMTDLLPEPKNITYEQAKHLAIPDGLSPEAEETWLVYEQRVPIGIATEIISERHPGEWPPPGVDF